MTKKKIEPQIHKLEDRLFRLNKVYRELSDLGYLSIALQIEIESTVIREKLRDLHSEWHRAID